MPLVIYPDYGQGEGPLELGDEADLRNVCRAWGAGLEKKQVA